MFRFLVIFFLCSLLAAIPGRLLAEPYYDAKDCTPAATVWNDWLELDFWQDPGNPGEEETVAGCFLTGKANTFVLDSFTYNIFTVNHVEDTAPLEFELSQGFPFDDITSIDDLLQYSAAEQEEIFNTLLPLAIHTDMQKILKVLRETFDQDSYDGKGAPLQLVTNADVIGEGKKNNAQTNGQGTIWYGKEEGGVVVTQFSLSHPEATFIRVNGHEFYHNLVESYGTGTSGSYCGDINNTKTRGMEEGLATSLGILLWQMIIPDGFPTYAIIPSGMQFTDFAKQWEEEEEKNAENSCAAHAYGDLVVSILQDLAIGVASKEGKYPHPFIVEPIGPEAVIAIILHISKNGGYPWYSYPQLADSFYQACTDMIGEPIGKKEIGMALGQTISGVDCAMVAKIFARAGLPPSAAGEISLAPYYKNVVMNLTLKDLVYDDEYLPQGKDWDEKIIYRVTVHNDGPQTWNYPVRLEASADGNKPFYTKTYPALNIQPSYQTHLFIPVKATDLAKGNLDLFQAKLVPIKKDGYQVSQWGGGDLPEVETWIGADYWLVKAEITPKVPEDNQPTPFIINFTFSNAGNKPIVGKLPLKLFADENSFAEFFSQGGQQIKPLWAPVLDSFVLPGETFVVTESITAMPGTEVIVLVDPYWQIMELNENFSNNQFSITLPKAKKKDYLSYKKVEVDQDSAGSDKFSPANPWQKAGDLRKYDSFLKRLQKWREPKPKP